MLDVLYDRNEVCIKRSPEGILVGGYRHDTHPIEGLTEEDLSKYVDEWTVNYDPDTELITNYKRVTKKGSDGESISGIVIPDEDGNETFYMWDGSYAYKSLNNQYLIEACLMTHLKHDDEFNDITFTIGFMDVSRTRMGGLELMDFDQIVEAAHKFYPEVDYGILKNIVSFVYEKAYDACIDEHTSDDDYEDSHLDWYDEDD